jgi:hypothetical protein
MNERVFRCSSVSILVFALLLILPGLAAAADEKPAAEPHARAASAAVAQAASCGACTAAYQKCSNTCFGRADKSGMNKCLTSCDNAAAKCTCNDVSNLRSEDLVSFDWPSVSKAACHGTVSCQPAYPSCASWSSYANCEDPYCGSGAHCGDCTCDEFRCFCGPGPALKQKEERFRVCFDQYGNSCTEWQQLILSECDDVDCP